jgi:phosphomannomutase / phosphoglucomutase
VSVFKACDIRGIVGEELDESVFRRLGRTLAGMIQRRGGGPTCVGGDFRWSTPTLMQALRTGLFESGANVIDVGQVPTPVVYFAGRYLDCSNVAIVTASHNAGRYNGLKFMIAGRPAVPGLVEELRTAAESEQASTSAPCAHQPENEPARHVASRHILDKYKSNVRSNAAALVPAPGRKLRVMIDMMCGAMSGIAEPVLAAEGFEVIAINNRVDPDFAAGSPNPAVDANLRPLAGRILAEHADLGLAFDGDGDRVAVVDNSGHVVRPEQIGALLVQHVFTRPTVVYDQKCASVLPRAVQAAGGRVTMRPSGHGFLKSTMIDEAADLGIEVSGHYFFKALGGGDDGLFAGLLVARLVAAAGTAPVSQSTCGATLADMVASIAWPAITPDLRIPVDGRPEDILEQVAASCDGQVSRLDGVRTEYDGGWALARTSITEPVMTFRFEGRDSGHLDEIVRRFLSGVPKLCERVLEHIHGGHTG